MIVVGIHTARPALLPSTAQLGMPDTLREPNNECPLQVRYSPQVTKVSLLPLN